ncbi:MAG TPA: aminoacyl-tRNA hydrolase [Verrucomicrobiae bacterium]|nr:aminoacyl-tRNA hydrolase [Verrucomicrobiae bacterium]
MDRLYLVAGLGNPGAEYRRTRHNAGFLAIERFGELHSAQWKEQSKFRSRVARIELGGCRVILCEPQTFMNASGEALVLLAEYHKVPSEHMLVVVDDADLPIGQVRMRSEGSSGGHHGLESIEKSLGTRHFPRLRVGIGRTDRELREITGHVLGRFSGEEADLLEMVLDRCARQIESYLSDGIQKAMSQFNGAVAAPDKKELK